MARYCFLLIILVVSFLEIPIILAKKTNEDDSYSTESKTSTDGAPEKIRQCLCDELNACREDHRTQLHSCVDECTSLLVHSEWNEAAGRKCFTDRGNLPPTCFLEELRKKTCSNISNVMLNRNETMSYGRHNHKLNDDSEMQRHAARRNPRRKYRQFLRNTFKESGNKYRKCVRACHKKVERSGSCQKKLKCALKRLDTLQWNESHAKCAAERHDRNNNFCECLEKSGIRKPNCYVDDTNHDAENNKVD